MDLNILDIFVLISLGQGIIFAWVVLFSGLIDKKENKYLAYCTLITSIIGFDEWFTYLGFSEKYYLLDVLGDDVPWILLVYVPLFLYFLNLVQHSFRKASWLPLIYVPFVIFLALNVYIDLAVDFSLYELWGGRDFQELVYEWEYYVAILYAVILGLLSLRILLRSQLKGKKLRWALTVWALSFTIVFTWFVLAFVPGWLNSGRLPLDYLIWMGNFGFVYWLSAVGLMKLRIEKTPPKTFIQARTTAQRSKNIPPNAETPLVNPHFLELEGLMKEKRVFLQANLSREILADQLGISTGYLSSLIKKETGKNLTTYINHFRTEEVKLLLLDPACQHYSLEAIGIEAGFKSRSHFFSTFKKMTGLTPAEYKKQHT